MSGPAWDALHVYAQASWHEPAAIVGSRAALEGLRAAIDRALAGEQPGARLEAMTADGEGFTAHVFLFDAGWEPWQKLILPYTDIELCNPEGEHPLTFFAELSAASRGAGT